MSQEIHVAPFGADRHGGSCDAPVASPAHAVQLSRQTTGPRTIFVHAGRYEDVHLTLTPADSGLTIRAAEDGPVEWVGGKTITNWQRLDDRFWAASLPGTAEGRWDFRMLEVAGRLAPRARYPHAGRLQHETVWPHRWISSTAGGWEVKPTEEQLTTVRYRAGDLDTWLDVRNAEITLYHAWDDSQVGLAALDPVTRTLRLRSPAGHPPGGFADHYDDARTYVLWNIVQGMHEPGQWYLDRTHGRLVYWPAPGQDMAHLSIVAPTQTSILRLAGTAEEPVRAVTLHGLTLSVTTTPCQAGGFGALGYDGAVHLQHTADCRLENLTVRNVGGAGLYAQHATGLDIAHNVVHHTGACGIVVHGTQSRIRNNHVHHTGRTYPAALAVRAGGADILIEANHVHHATYTGINACGRGIVARLNHIHHVMQELYDGAAIYMFGAKSCAIQNNFAHDIAAPGTFARRHAWYLDEQSEDSRIEGNLAINTGWPYHGHMARACVIERNVSHDDGPVQITLPLCRDFRFTHNVVTAAGITLEAAGDGLAEFSGNILTIGAQGFRRVELEKYHRSQPQPLTELPGNVLRKTE